MPNLVVISPTTAEMNMGGNPAPTPLSSKAVSQNAKTDRVQNTERFPLLILSTKKPQKLRFICSICSGFLVKKYSHLYHRSQMRHSTIFKLFLVFHLHVYSCYRNHLL